MRLSDFHYGVQELLQSAVQSFSWAFRDLIGQQREWTPTAIPRTVTTSGNVNPLDDVVLVDASASAVTMTLETAVACDGRQHTFKKIDAGTNAMTIDGNGSETIDGTANLAYTIQNVAVTLKSDGINWRRVSGADAYPQAGRYSPTLTNQTNVAASSADTLQWGRIGPFVAVAGRVLIDPTSADQQTLLRMSLPVPSNFTGQGDLGGVAFCQNVQQGAAIRAEVSADLAQFIYQSNTISDQPFFFIFAYYVM